MKSLRSVFISFLLITFFCSCGSKKMGTAINHNKNDSDTSSDFITPLLITPRNTNEIYLINQTKYDSAVDGIHIFAGNWRPLFNTEQIAWINPPWASTEFIWLDFPEAIKVKGVMWYLSHINPRIPVKYNDVRSVPWKVLPGGIYYEQKLPNGVRFGGQVIQKDDYTVDLELWIENGSAEYMNDIKIQTCAYLGGIDEFNQRTNDNKFIHSACSGWITLSDALQSECDDGKYYVGWGEGYKVADLPVIVTVSKDKEHIVAFTWWGNINSFIGNPKHPCFHSDPFFPDLGPYQSHKVHGNLIFFKGSLNEFKSFFINKYLDK